MGWKKRGNRWYFYRSRRIDGRVVTEYIGAGERANELIAKQKQKAAQKAAIDAVNAATASLSSPLNELDALTESLAAAELVSEGYHRPGRKPWRKRREQA